MIRQAMKRVKTVSLQKATIHKMKGAPAHNGHHERVLCTCGTVIRVCKCHEKKTDTYIERGCAQCQQFPMGKERHAQKR